MFLKGEYEQNLCPLSSANCELCPLRLPSCVGKSDGNHSFIGRRWEPIYITCYQNRTIKIGKCPHGYFHPVNNVCQSKIGHGMYLFLVNIVSFDWNQRTNVFLLSFCEMKNDYICLKQCMFSKCYHFKILYFSYG